MNLEFGKSVRVGVVGVGKLGELHSKLLAELALERKDMIFSGVFDENRERLKAVAKKHNTKAFENIEHLSEECDALIIATPTSFHFQVSLSLLKKGKHLFIEKPITATPEEAEQLIRLETEHSAKIQVGHIERFNPALVAAEPHLGEPVFITAERLAGFTKRATDVSVVLDLMIHDIDLILSIIQSPVTSVSATGASVFSDEWDIANARLEFQNGAVATVTSSRISRAKVRKMRLFCKNPNAYASLDLTSGKSEIFKIVPIAETKERKRSLKEFATEKILTMFGEVEDVLKGNTIEYFSLEAPKINALKAEQESFIESILYQKPIRVGSTDGKKALEVAADIVREISKRRLKT
ncbi:MAG: Gfo/Idh/MocA family oxidoreductase [Chloroherpetonaceae bacterium]|nr:Gfo/Idh/MocA family oxidoreductase [Chloroherpetonaceae bacterium]